MTSLRQIDANRRNALNSTDPKTENGKQQSRRNALRHGFTAETVIEPLERDEEYRAFEEAIVAEYLPRTPLQEELAHRLASIFWRLRRATAIETGLLRMQAEILSEFRSSRPKMACQRERDADRAVPPFAACQADLAPEILGDAIPTGQPQQARTEPPPMPAPRAVAVSFLRLVNLENGIVDRLSRYEAALWKQAVQTVFALQTLKRR